MARKPPVVGGRRGSRSDPDMPDPELTDTEITSFANAVFDTPGVDVLEAYSIYGKVPRQFESAIELVQYINESLSTRKGMAYFFVVYPDMVGRAIRKKIHLKHDAVPGESFRYTWEWWGLISVIFDYPDQRVRKHCVSANSKKRAEKWSATYPEWPTPDTWNWPAVERHTRRLRRAMKTAIEGVRKRAK